MLVTEAGRNRTLREDPFVAQQMIGEDAGAPRRRVRVHRAIDRDALFVAVRVLRIERIEPPVRPEDGRMGYLNSGNIPFHTMLAVQVDRGAGTEEIELRH